MLALFKHKAGGNLFEGLSSGYTFNGNTKFVLKC